jgi:type VI protein secretion system component VasK
MGAIIPIGTFFPGRGITSWLIAWGIGLAVIVPWSLWAIVRIRREDWPDLVLDAEPGVEETPHV